MFDCSPSMMLLYHRPVPAKIPKRRSRAGKHYLLPSAARCNVTVLIKHDTDRCDVSSLQDVFIGETTCIYCKAILNMLTMFLAKRKRRNATKNDRSVTVASSEG